MTRRLFVALGTTLAFTAPLAGQSLGARVTASDGRVQIVYPSRPGACGDGQSFIGNVFGHNQFYSGDVSWSNRNAGGARRCVPGPARLVATVTSGEVTRVRAYVGPVPSTESDVRTINAGAAETSAWMSDVILHGNSR